MTQRCECEHWQFCPVCAPQMFDGNGNRLPPEPTPLEAAKSEIERLRAENERLREDAERLDSGCIRLVDRDDFGESVATVYSQVDLRAAIDAARGEK